MKTIHFDDSKNVSNDKTFPDSNEDDSFLSSNRPGNESVTVSKDENNSESEDNNSESEENSVVGNSTENSYTQSETNSGNEYSEETYTEIVKAPETKTKTVKEKEKKKTTSKGNTVTYIVSEGDNLSSIADENGLSVGEIKELNGLETDKILVGQKLKLSGSSTSASKTSVHTVSSGENLTMIAGKYGMSLSELREINDLDSDIIIKGQKLKVTGSKSKGNTNSGKKSTGKTTHKVKSGETLASVASEYGVSISELMKWNKLKSDKILIGQVLKLSGDSGKKKKK
ncbi:MAG: LysM peptidoglycan-binding domain-containing protein [Ignavibacteria bacterium]|nr:LysM peptidoglycan-binding domain-containing protein [Ignavibacteria bacterium]